MVGFPGGSAIKNPPSMQKTQETWVPFLVWEDLRSLVFLPGEFQGQKRLVGYSPRGRKESDTTERLHFHFKKLKCNGSVKTCKNFQH